MKPLAAPTPFTINHQADDEQTIRRTEIKLAPCPTSSIVIPCPKEEGATTTYRISPAVLERAVEIGISTIGAEERVFEMARLAARLTHPDANRRFRQYIMWIGDDGEVTMFDVMAAEEAAYYNARTHRERRAETGKAAPKLKKRTPSK